MNVVDVVNTAKSFDLAADRCSEPRPLPQNQFEMLAVPAIVCRAFAAEVGLKALLLHTGGAARGHDLHALFGQLRRTIRDSLIAATGLPSAAFDRELSSVANAFVEWRYVFETARAAINLNFLTSFSKAVIDALPRTTTA